MTKLQLENLKLLRENIELKKKLIKARDIIKQYNNELKKINKKR